MLWDASGWDNYWDDPDSWVLYADKINFISGVLVKFMIAPGYAGYYQLVIDGVDVGPPIYCVDGVPLEITGNYPAPTPDNKHLVTLAGLGPWNNDFFNVVWQQQLFEDQHPDRIRFTVSANPDLFSIGDRGQFSNWKLNGILRFQNCRQQNDRPSWAELDLTLHTETGSDNTRGTDPGFQAVYLSLNGVVQAYGLISPSSDASGKAVPGTVTLQEVNNSGISGTVQLAYDHDCSGLLVAAFPTEYRIYWRQTPWTSADFTLSHHAIPNDRIEDDGHSTSYPYESPPLSSVSDAETGGRAWYVVVHQVNDVEVEGIGTNNVIYFIDYVPKPPGDLSLVAGASDGKTVAMFAASVDSACQYNLYDSAEAGILPITPSELVPAGVGILFATLPVIPPGFTGLRLVMVRSLLDGVESDETNILQIHYINGIAQPELPNSPAMGIQIGTIDLQLTVPWTYNTAKQLIAPTHIQLFIWGVDVAPDYAAPINSVPITTPKIGTVIFGTITGSVSSDGEYYYGIKALSPNGQDPNLIVNGPIRLTTQAPADPIIVGQ